MAFQEDGSLGIGTRFYEKVILPDERRFLLSEARQHMVVVEPGSVTGDRIEFIVNGKPTVQFEEWVEMWETHRDK